MRLFRSAIGFDRGQRTAQSYNSDTSALAQHTPVSVCVDRHCVKKKKKRRDKSSSTAIYKAQSRRMWVGMRQTLRLIRLHPGTLLAGLVLVSTMYTYARILVLQCSLGALQYWIHRYPRNFPHGFFIPFYYISTTAAFFAAIAHDCLVLQSGLWKYVLPIPMTTSGRLYRVVGVPLYAFTIAATEAVQFFRNPSMESDLSRLAVYFQVLSDNSLLDDMKLRKMISDIKWHAWSLQTTNPTTASYIRLPLELLLALVVCVVYGIASFCNEPRHGKELSASLSCTIGLNVLADSSTLISLCM